MIDKATATATKIEWSSLTGVILEGGYELKDAVDVRDEAAQLRVRILGSGGKTGHAYFLKLEPADAEDQLDLWQMLREAPHPNVSRPMAVGRHAVGGVETVYLVLADADESLAAVVPERPLEWEEAAEVLQSCEKGLAHLHGLGLMHGSVSPQTVEAVGYSVQLNTASVRRIGKKPHVEWNKPQYLAPESKEGNLTAAADVWCMGATLFEVLAQQPYGTPGVELEQGLPLAAVILRCLDKNPVTRCTLKDASTISQTPAAAVPVEETQKTDSATSKAGPPSYMRPPEDRSAGAGARSTPAVNRIPQPLTPPRSPARQVTKEDMALVPVGKRHRRVQRQPVGARIRTLDESEVEMAASEAASAASAAPAVSARILALGSKSKLMRNLLPGAVCLLLLVWAVWYVIIPKLQSTDQPLTNAVTAPIVVDSRFGPPSNAQKPELPANLATNQATDSAQEDAPPVPVPRVKHDVYRVVLSSFHTRAEAARELDTLSQQHSDLILRLSPMTSETGEIKYVVGVGGYLTQEEAQSLQQRLLGKGLRTAHLERAR